MDDGARPAASARLLGAEHGAAGDVALRDLGATACALSVGGPVALERKRGTGVPNEDALFACDDGGSALHVVADGHFGHRASHEAVERAARIAGEPGRRLEPADSLDWTGGSSLDGDRSRTTIVACALDRESGELWGWSAGDSAVFLFRLGGEVERLTEPRLPYAAPHAQPALRPDEVHRFRRSVRAGDTVLTCSDGVFECHYRSPATSVTADDLAELVRRSEGHPLGLARAVTGLALAGVRGHPGGEDNIAVAVTRV